MMYSVWDHAARAYNYYRTPETSAATSAPKPAHLRSARLGLSPEQAAWPLPSNARLVGKGKYPKGFIAHPKEGLGAVPLSLTTTNMIVMGVLGYVAYKHLTKEKR